MRMTIIARKREGRSHERADEALAADWRAIPLL
jgi:hypothetical protein